MTTIINGRETEIIANAPKYPWEGWTYDVWSHTEKMSWGTFLTYRDAIQCECALMDIPVDGDEFLKSIGWITL